MISSRFVERAFEVEKRPFYATQDGTGRPVHIVQGGKAIPELLAAR